MHVVRPLKADHVALRDRAEITRHARAIAGAREEVLQHAHVVAAHPLPQRPIAHVLRVARVVMPVAHDRGRRAEPAAASAR